MGDVRRLRGFRRREQRLAALGRRRDGITDGWGKQNDIAAERHCWSCLREDWQGSSFTSRLIEGHQVLCVYSSCQPVFVTARGERTLLSEEQRWNYRSPSALILCRLPRLLTERDLSLSLSLSPSLCVSLSSRLCSVSTLSLKEELWTALTHSCPNDFILAPRKSF